MEKKVFTGLLKVYDQENLEKINKEIELNKASRHDKFIHLIENTQANTTEYIREPARKTQDQLEKL